MKLTDRLRSGHYYHASVEEATDRIEALEAALAAAKDAMTSLLCLYSQPGAPEGATHVRRGSNGTREWQIEALATYDKAREALAKINSVLSCESNEVMGVG